MALLFDDTRPYVDAEISAAMKRITEHIYFPLIVRFLFPDKSIADLKKFFLGIDTVHLFQTQVMHPSIASIVRQTCTGYTGRGTENASNDRKAMFISNHRDILLDAALLQMTLYAAGLETSEITFGSNLMKNQFAVDIGKSNKMFKIVRGGNMKDFYKNSMEVSSYMRYAITEKHESTWIAQRNGRTKDGDDKTELAVLKMFSLSSEKPFAENLDELNITPVAISYEYEPCDFLKAQETYISRYGRYVKSEGEDMNSIMKGIMQPKGDVNLVITPAITLEELIKCEREEKNARFAMLAKIIDDRIYSAYVLYKTNYIAFDILHNTNAFHAYYTEEQKKEFIDYMNEGLKDIPGDMEELRSIFLGIYANPVKNTLHI